jgi:hypothetical protein
MIKKTRPTKHYPGELERLTALIEHRAQDIAHVLLHGLPDAEQWTEDARVQGRVRPAPRSKGSAAKPKPDKKRDIMRREAISEWRHKAFRH